MSYTKIINPKTGRAVSIYGQQGNSIIEGYYNFLIKNGHTSQMGGSATSNTGSRVKDASYVLNSHWRTLLLKEKMKKTPLWLNATADTQKLFDLMLKNAINIVRPEGVILSGVEKMFYTEIIRELIKMCGGRMNVYIVIHGQTAHEVVEYDIDLLETQIALGDKELTKIHLSMEARSEDTNYAFKTLYGHISDAITTLKKSMDEGGVETPSPEVPDQLKYKATPEAMQKNSNVQVELDLMVELLKYLNQWEKHVAETGAELDLN